MANYYKVLGVDNNATDAEIKTAYKKAAVLKHPDKQPHNPNATQEFQDLNNAYNVLRDSEQRQQHDADLKREAELEAVKKQNAHFQFYAHPTTTSTQAAPMNQKYEEKPASPKAQKESRPSATYGKSQSNHQPRNEQRHSPYSRTSFFDHGTNHKRKTQDVYAGFFMQDEPIIRPAKIGNRPFVSIIVTSPLLTVFNLINEYMNKLDAINRMTYDFWSEHQKNASEPKFTGLFLRTPSEIALEKFLIAAQLESMIFSKNNFGTKVGFAVEETISIETPIARPRF